MADIVSAKLVREEIIDDFNWRVNRKEIGIIWKYSLWEFTDADGNKNWTEKSHGTLHLYFISVPLTGEERNLPSCPDPA
ncbi:hypothetical protein C8P63_10350 [Melghirimyces profundicolus]|uniref:Uncharacterized protein n=1 Tax=Melghirimyces profundicolus TaxID=1242148 RepID=A0A2T6C7G8_9BACL|nr:hypothetical protein [Melghirimyces profundicolus]PTX64268.1 hypothetical protein C8P63_10350 [Melghirimyces profundicolus]